MIRVLKYAINSLLSCPFCGSESELIHDPPYDIYIARCPKCDIRAYSRNREEVTNKWNNRVGRKEIKTVRIKKNETEIENAMGRFMLLMVQLDALN